MFGQLAEKYVMGHMTSLSYFCKQGVMLKAPPANTAQLTLDNQLIGLGLFLFSI